MREPVPKSSIHRLISFSIVLLKAESKGRANRPIGPTNTVEYRSGPHSWTRDPGVYRGSVAGAANTPLPLSEVDAGSGENEGRWPESPLTTG